MWLLALGIIGGALYNRIGLLLITPSKSDKRAWSRADPSLKAWRLSAVEPIVTLVAFICTLIPAFLSSTVSPFFILLSLTTLFVVPLLYSRMIYKEGEGCRRARLAISMIGVRTMLIGFAVILQQSVPNMWNNVYIIIVCAYLLQTVFAGYQKRVLKREGHGTGDTRRSPMIPAIDAGVQDDIVLIGGNELWDEQVALIERLKADEVTAEASPEHVQAIADQLVAEKNITVGRAKELL